MGEVPVGHAMRTDVVLGDDEWKTSDMYFAAFLQSSGMQMKRHVKSRRDGGRPKIWFLFEKTDSLERLKQDYHTGAAKVSAIEFVMRIRAIKSLVHT